MKTKLFFALFVVISTVTSFSQSWTHEVSIPEITTAIFPVRTSTGTMMCKFPSSTWSANQIPTVNPGQTALVSIVVPPGVSAVYCSYESNVWQQQNAEAPRFGHVEDNPGDYISSPLTRPTGVEGNVYYYDGSVAAGGLSGMAYTNPNGLTETSVHYGYLWITNPNHIDNDPFYFSSITIYYTVNNIEIYNDWVNNGYATPDECETFNAGEITSQQTVCINSSPTEISSENNASGGDGSISYKWETNTDTNNINNWVEIVGATNETYVPITVINEDTLYFRRVAYTNCGHLYSNISIMYVTTCASIPNVHENSFEIFPNPASTYVMIESKKLKGESLQIVDITGKVINQVKSNKTQDIRLDISNLQNGVYFIKVGTQVQKFIKE